VPRLLKHSLFWLISGLFLVFVLGLQEGHYTSILLFVIALLPIAFATSYAFNYHLIPKYLFKEEFSRFFIYSILLVTTSVYSTVLIILSLLIWQGNSFQNMPFQPVDGKTIGIALYLIVSVYSVIHLLRNKKVEKHTPTFIDVKANRKVKRIHFKDIVYIESLGDYVKIHELHDIITTKEKIGSLEKRLPEAYFIRTHRSFIINKSKVSEFTKEKVMILDKQIPISRTFKKDTLNALS